MKKNKSFFLGILIGVIITATIGVSAATIIGANEVSLFSSKTPKTTVQDALDDLYVKCEAYVASQTYAELVGTYTADQSIDVSSVIKSGDTADNFIVEPAITTVNASSVYFTSSEGPTKGGTRTTNITKTLSGNTLSVTGFSGTANTDRWSSSAYSIKYNVYHIVGKVQLIDSYTENQTIDISSLYKAGITKNNFFIEPTKIELSVRTVYDSVNHSGSGNFNLSKEVYVSDKTLGITGVKGTVNPCMQLSSTFTATYNLYFLG